jgi:hypothetical protein
MGQMLIKKRQRLPKKTKALTRRTWNQTHRRERWFLVEEGAVMVVTN